MDKLNADSGVTSIKGIGAGRKSNLAAMGISTVGDLLEYFPYKYRDRRSIIPSARAPENRDVLVSGRLTGIRSRQLSGRRTMTECTFREAEGDTFDAVFFNMPYLKNSLHHGADYVLFGKMRYRYDRRVWTNPEITQAGSARDLRGIIPVYRAGHGISSQAIAGFVRTALDAADLSESWLGSGLIEERRLCSRGFALRSIHFPESDRHYKAARYRIIYEQLLIYQTAIRFRRNLMESGASDASVADIDISPFISSLPFELTEGQAECVAEIERDLTDKRPMNRLVQGDVGCGKTVVAECAIYKCVRSGKQAAMMAPTEILAGQHYARLREDLGRHGISTALLVSGMSRKDRRDLIERIGSGDIDVVVGTHALIQKDVVFRDLALVITDEQHRFGVEQRRTLASKGGDPEEGSGNGMVNVCVMSATPIPRTMAATVYGDMDFSVIRTKPSSRRKIITRVLDPGSRERAYTAVAEQIAQGNLAYIVAPSIDSEDDDMNSAEKLYAEVSSRFRRYRVALLHGRMTGAEKERIMSDFAAGRYSVLVSTVVIEVGIDVSDATIMVIENSERFGLAQMHQLRGRVGRSDKQSYCYLINYSKSESAAARARAMAELSDGFEISEADYKLRGPGDIMGTLQSGSVSSNIINLCSYTDILELAVRDAENIISGSGGIYSGCDPMYAYRRMAEASAHDNSNVL